MKRFFAIIMALLMILTFAACGNNDKSPSSTEPDVTTSPSETSDPDVTDEPDETSDPVETDPPPASDGTVFNMPFDWSAATETDPNGWVMPYIGQWKLLGYSDLDTATPKLTDSSLSISDYRSQNLGSGGHGNLPGPYFGVHDNEAAIQNNDGVAYKQGGWYTNWNQRWSGKTFSATSDDSGIYAVAHGGKPGAIVFTAANDGVYTYSETVELLLFAAGGTELSFEVTVRKNGEVLSKFVPSSTDTTDTLTGTVTLKAGDVLMFAFEQKTNVVFSSSQPEHKSNDPNCFFVTDVTVAQQDHVCSSETMTKHDSAPDFCISNVDSYYSCYCGALYTDVDAKNPITEKAHNWNNGSCENCGKTCEHNVSADSATCNKEAVCGICGCVVAPISESNHTDKDGAYRYIGDGKHQFNRTCCDNTDIKSEECMYNNDNVCDKCGHDKTKGETNPILVAMANQTKKEIQVFDISAGNMNEPVWSYKITVGGVSGFKLRNYAPYGDVLFVTVGTNVEMVSVDTKEVIWRTNNTPGNSHSMDIMPNGIVAVGGTVGHDIHFYNINGEDPTKVLYELPLQHAHGILWDPEYQVLWVTGHTHLWALNVTLNDDGTVTVEKNLELTAPDAPDTDTHDLQPYRGDKNKLLVSTSHHLYVYDKVEKTYTSIVDQNAIKGVGNTVDGGLFYMYYDGGDDNGQGGGWNTTYIEYIAPGSELPVQIHSNQGRFYKCRLWDASYQ